MSAAQLNQIAAFARGLNVRIEEGLQVSFGRSLSELTALVSIQNCDQFHIGWLAETLGLQHSSAVRVVDRLEQDRLISRLDKDAKKQVGLKISKSGATLARKVLALRAQITEAYLAAISDLYRHCALCDDGACTNCPAGSEACNANDKPNASC